MLIGWSKAVEVEMEKSTWLENYSGLKIHMAGLWNKNGEQKKRDLFVPASW